MEVLPPIAWNVFVARYPQYVGKAELTPPLKNDLETWNRLYHVNTTINKNIVYDATCNVIADPWKVDPVKGNCNDYAVSKRAALLNLGYPASCLLLSECKLTNGEHHLVLLVRIGNNNIVVMDNRFFNIFYIEETFYTYVYLKTQSLNNPNKWVDDLPTKLGS